MVYSIPAKSHQNAVLYTFLLALALSSFSFLLQGNIGLNIADEGYLWYGTIRTAVGDIPVRDLLMIASSSGVDIQSKIDLLGPIEKAQIYNGALQHVLATQDPQVTDALHAVLADCYEQGADIAWADLYTLPSKRRISLPTYPFQGDDYWLESPSYYAANATKDGLANNATHVSNRRFPDTPTCACPWKKRRRADPQKQTTCCGPSKIQRLQRIWTEGLGCPQREVETRYGPIPLDTTGFVETVGADLNPICRNKKGQSKWTWTASTSMQNA